MTRFFAVAVLATGWLAAYAIELLARVMHRLYAVSGLDLPAPTVLAISAVQSYIPAIIVGAATLAVAGLWLTKSRHLALACSALALIVAAGASVAVFSLALPQLTLCGGLGLPEWHVAQPSSQAAGACAR